MRSSPEEALKERDALPEAPAPPSLPHVFDDLLVGAIRDDQMVEALADTPLSLSRLPVELPDGEPAERARRLVGDDASLGQDGGEVALEKIVVHRDAVARVAASVVTTRSLDDRDRRQPSQRRGV
jgi:hypothetical protein